MPKMHAEAPIEATLGVCVGGPCIAGHRIRVQDIVIVRSRITSALMLVCAVFLLSVLPATAKEIPAQLPDPDNTIGPGLIKSWRTEFQAPDAPFVLATIGFGGWEMAGSHLTVANAQLAVSGDKGKYPEFAGNALTVETRDFWRDTSLSPSA